MLNKNTNNTLFKHHKKANFLTYYPGQFADGIQG